eukprot:934664-Rhodomonas_salina.1
MKRHDGHDPTCRTTRQRQKTHSIKLSVAITVFLLKELYLNFHSFFAVRFFAAVTPRTVRMRSKALDVKTKNYLSVASPVTCANINKQHRTLTPRSRGSLSVCATLSASRQISRTPTFSRAENSAARAGWGVTGLLNPPQVVSAEQRPAVTFP